MEKKQLFLNHSNQEFIRTQIYLAIIGQVDYDNYGISGIEKYFDKDLKDENLAGTPLELTLDTNIQHLISKELNDALITFKAVGGAALLINVENGEILSLVSLQILILIRELI